MIRVILPAHLKNLAHVSGELRLEVAVPVTQRVVPLVPVRTFQATLLQSEG